MLHFETVEPGAFSVLKQLMQLKELQAFSLVGGTALSLRYGHRTSIDLDLFCPEAFNSDQIVDTLKKEFGEGYRTESKNVRWGVFCYIRDVKVDLVHYPLPLIDNIEENDDIRLFSDKDIIGMKLNAILGRGRKKDFWDLYELLKYYPLTDMIAFHEKKYPDQNLLISIPQAIIYFEDADESEDPVSLKGQTWDSIKQYIRDQVRNYLK
jgi:predicted nucleotidyltransferase component of viral defense system